MILTILTEDLVSSARLVFYFLAEAAAISAALVLGVLFLYRATNEIFRL